VIKAVPAGIPGLEPGALTGNETRWLKSISCSDLFMNAHGRTVAGCLGRAFNPCAAASTPPLTVLPVRSGQSLQGATT
jgi:hypothetical protein